MEWPLPGGRGTQLARHATPSLLLSLDDEPWRPSRRLLNLAGQLAASAPDVAHTMLEGRPGGGPRWYRQFPGEHYHLLTALCRLLQPRLVWEFGTDTGMSTVALLEGLPPESHVVTVDIVGWRDKPGPWLVEGDFASGRVTQLVADMQSPDVFGENLESLIEAELIFVDGPKDGVTERNFLAMLALVPFRQPPVVMFDDIRLMNMVQIWRSIGRPKMDMTSFGHWSGTGLVDWRDDQPAEPDANVVVQNVPLLNVQLTNVAVKNVSPRSVAAVARTVTSAIRPARAERILMLCHAKPNYVPDLLLHGLRKLLGPAVVDTPRKDAVYDGCLGQAVLERIPGLMQDDTDVDRSDIATKLAAGFFDLVLCDVRAIAENRALLQACEGRLALIDGEDCPVPIGPGRHVILRRETDGGDFSVPLPMAMPAELLDWIDRHADTPKTRSIGFLGSRSRATPARNALLDALEGIFPDALIGSWDVHAGAWQGRDAYYHALQSCQVVLSLPGAGLDTFRYWENAACQSAHVSQRMNLFIPQDFRDGQEIVRFSDVDELVNAVRRIASGEIDGHGLAENSRAWLRAHHTTELRAETILTRLQTALLR